jgi:hypothetical protein
MSDRMLWDDLKFSRMCVCLNDNRNICKIVIILNIFEVRRIQALETGALKLNDGGR